MADLNIHAEITGDASSFVAAVQEASSAAMSMASAFEAQSGAGQLDAALDTGLNSEDLLAVREAIGPITEAFAQSIPAAVQLTLNTIGGLPVAVAAAQKGTVAPLAAIGNSFNLLAGQALRAASAVRSIQAAINSLRSRTITVSAVAAGGAGGNAAAGGGQFVTSGPTNLLIGDNPGGRELVQVTPLSGRGQTRVNTSSGLQQIRAAGGATVVASGRGGSIRIEVPVLLDGIEVGRGAIEGTLDALQQRGVLEGALGG